MGVKGECRKNLIQGFNSFHSFVMLQLSNGIAALFFIGGAIYLYKNTALHVFNKSLALNKHNE